MLLRSPRVLVVEDEALIALLIEDALDAAGYRVVGVAGSETDALKLVGEHPPEFAVLDINLGTGGSGLNLGQALHAQRVRILYASGNCNSYMAEMAATGARAFLNKPYRPDDVPRALDALGRIGRGESADCLPASFQLLDPGR
jgi:DNA-binding response OmpR family regulator